MYGLAAKEKKRVESLFAQYDGPGFKRHIPMKEHCRDNGRLLQTARNFRDAAAREGDSVYACVSVGIFALRHDQIRRIALAVAKELEIECTGEEQS